MQQKLTDRLVERLKPGKGSIRIWDVEVKGFALRVFPTGHKSYVFQFTRGKAKIQATIGSADCWSCADARERARQLRKLHEDGKDALATLVEERSQKDLEDLVKCWREDYKPKVRPHSQATFESLLKKILPELGSRLVRDLSLADVEALHRRIAKEGHVVTANRTVTILRRLLSVARPRIKPKVSTVLDDLCPRADRGEVLRSLWRLVAVGRLRINFRQTFTLSSIIWAPNPAELRGIGSTSMVGPDQHVRLHVNELVPHRHWVVRGEEGAYRGLAFLRVQIDHMQVSEAVLRRPIGGCLEGDLPGLGRIQPPALARTIHRLDHDHQVLVFVVINQGLCHRVRGSGDGDQERGKDGQGCKGSHAVLIGGGGGG